MTKEDLAPFAFSIAEACAAARIGRTTIYKEIGAGRLRAIKHGGRTLVLPSDLRRWLESGPPISPKPEKVDAGCKGVRDCSPGLSATSPAERGENQ
jgi:excisionase family DNA binding protein